ncbi:hypothetical protein ACIOD1_06600 [Streptomyces sp. NPDC088097]|uniref:hypothetical protein n=1 Tax=Streptomyces sp. NPDC088097 TaxID=3365823 RepID=UPI003830E217
MTPRELREDVGGDKQQLVPAFFPDEDSADQAAQALRDWEKATEYMKVDAIGVLVKDEQGQVKEHKLGRRAGKRGMGIGAVLGVIAAIPTGGLSLVGGAVASGVGCSTTLKKPISWTTPSSRWSPTTGPAARAVRTDRSTRTRSPTASRTT